MSPTDKAFCDFLAYAVPIIVGSTIGFCLISTRVQRTTILFRIVQSGGSFKIQWNHWGWWRTFDWPLWFDIDTIWCSTLAEADQRLNDVLERQGRGRDTVNVTYQLYNQRRLESLVARDSNVATQVRAVESKVERTLDPIHILFEVPNSELRQSLIAKYGGFEALLSKVKHDILHTDDYGVLFRVWVPKLSKHFYYVKVINGTVEANGSRREYYKEVPPDMDTAKEAVAWTYGMHPDDYDVAIRT